MNKLQLEILHKQIDKLQKVYGEKTLKPIYGAGNTDNPNLMMIFMNPTAKNISSNINWRGIRAPWIGTKNIWKLLFQVGLLEEKLFYRTQQIRTKEWTTSFAMSLYCSIAQKKVFITNFAKCTQLDARPLNNSIFKSYRDILLEEIYCLNPKAIITLGIQVSENLLNKKIFLKNYSMLEKESIEIKGQRFYVFPCPYPVGQGIRNMSLAVNRIKNIITDISYTKKI